MGPVVPIYLIDDYFNLNYIPNGLAEKILANLYSFIFIIIVD